MMLMFYEHSYNIVQLFISVVFMYNIAYVRATIQCARTQDEWNKASASLQCQEPNFYHCLRNENGILTQQCLQRVWIQNGMCPEFNSRVGKIDVFKCQSDGNNCPSTIFWSNAVYIYPICYDKTSATSSYSIIPSTFSYTTSPNTTSSGSINQETVDFKVILPVVIAIVVFAALIVTCTMVVYRRRKKYRGSEREEELRNEIPTDSQTRQSEHNRDINEEEKLIGSTIEFEKEKKEVHILILLCVRSAVLDENIVKKEAMKELKVAVDTKNSYRKWTNNKTEKSYVFQDWVQLDKEYDDDDLRNTQLEIRNAIKRNKTKFVVVLPLKIWTKYELLKEMGNWSNCTKKTIHPN
ncbi:uncharacterized protein LOC128155671 isoform X3 [Crassostrea angulata]|uniref:uncharacterized protein LOC128155671 isoform X3 n=1 Tax=Magallana angulata TaxID=2784310 RepID=UPI0022B0F0CB|nr:uncharacterized protein LOC128155671 isoform X3 [Crassostrea angulata]